MTAWPLLLIIHQFSTASYKDALPEILEVLRAACLTHKLPLAQTWVTCAQQGKRGSRHSDENYRYCISTIDEACFVNEPKMQDFHDACSEHHLLRGQGVAGKAFTTNQPCFLPDISSCWCVVMGRFQQSLISKKKKSNKGPACTPGISSLHHRLIYEL